MNPEWNCCKFYWLIANVVVLLLIPLCCGQFSPDNGFMQRNENALQSSLPINTTTQLEVLDEKSFGGIENRGRRSQRKTADKSKGSRSMTRSKTRSEADEVEKPEKNGKGNDDNYHVRYETKFAFQNVDEFGLKVKYNKTEHVFYGDTVANMTVPQTQPAMPEALSCLDPAGRTFTIGQTSNLPGECTLRRCEPGGIFSTQATCQYPSGQATCAPDLSKPFPECCECAVEAYNQFYTPGANQAPMGGMGMGMGMGMMGQTGFRASPHDGSLAPLVGEDSLEMIECRKMNFLDYEYEKPIEGMCIMCYRGQGTYRYIQGCQRMDCDAFLPTDPTAPFPDCCPACVGERPIIPNAKDADVGNDADAADAPEETPEERMMPYDVSSEMNEDELESGTSPDRFTDIRRNDPMEASTRDEVPEESKIGMSYLIDPDYERKLKSLRESRRRKLF